MRPKGTSSELERRRRRAVELVEQGESPTVVARILGVRPASLHRWRRLAQKPHGLDAKPIPGRPSHLSDYHLRKLERLLRQGAKKHGWPNDLWTADFKGWWVAKDGTRCEPLTVRDAHSRYLLALQITETTAYEQIRAFFEELFARYGLPKCAFRPNVNARNGAS